MRCGLYNQNGRLITEGPCGLRRDGAIEMLAEEPSQAVSKGDGPLTLVEGPRRYEVRVDDVHGVRDQALIGPVEVYHLVPVE